MKRRTKNENREGATPPPRQLSLILYPCYELWRITTLKCKYQVHQSKTSISIVTTKSVFIWHYSLSKRRPCQLRTSNLIRIRDPLFLFRKLIKIIFTSRMGSKSFESKNNSKSLSSIDFVFWFIFFIYPKFFSHLSMNLNAKLMNGRDFKSKFEFKAL
jgi:hypothetical protein